MVIVKKAVTKPKLIDLKKIGTEGDRRQLETQLIESLGDDFYRLGGYTLNHSLVNAKISQLRKLLL